jgi:hypothetical protein
MRKLTLDLDSLAVVTFEPGIEEPVPFASAESCTCEASLMWCATTGGPLFCLAQC